MARQQALRGERRTFLMGGLTPEGAAALVAAFVFLGGVAESEAPQYQLVRADRSRPEVQLFRPVQMDDGSYARPVRALCQTPLLQHHSGAAGGLR